MDKLYIAHGLVQAIYFSEYDDSPRVWQMRASHELSDCVNFCYGCSDWLLYQYVDSELITLAQYPIALTNIAVYPDEWYTHKFKEGDAVAWYKEYPVDSMIVDTISRKGFALHEAGIVPTYMVRSTEYKWIPESALSAIKWEVLEDA